MTRFDLSDERVLTITSQVHDDPSLGARSVVDVLADEGVPTHYTVAALNSLYVRGLVDCGPRLDFAWPTKAGRKVLEASCADTIAAAGAPVTPTAAPAGTSQVPVCGEVSCLTCPASA